MSFDDIRFPAAISRGATGGPERRTEIVALASGAEERNSRWAHSRRRYEAGFGVKSLADLAAVIAFFEERRGRLHGFRWKDHADYKSSANGASVSPLDQRIGTGDGAAFQLVKRYGSGLRDYLRVIGKPVAATVRLAVDGVETGFFTVDAATGVVTFAPGHAPPPGAHITAGFEFDVPVRFDTDRLAVNLAHFEAGDIPHIPVIEVRP
jgi:uncharacterized protein (TIGR02217 family)